MPSASNIVIADSVPVSRTYAPQQISNGLASFVDRTTQSMVGAQSTLVLTFSPLTAKRKTDRIGVRLNLPKVVNVGGVDTIVSTARFIGEFVVPEDWTLLDRNNLEKLVANAFDSAAVLAMVKDRDPQY